MNAESDISELFRRANEKRNRAIGAQRIGSLNALFAYRYGGNREDYIFPEDDAGLEDLKILLHHYALNNPLAMPRITKLRAPWMTAGAAKRLFEQIEAFPQKWRADTLGRKLNLTGADWRILRLRTIAPVDMTEQERVTFSQALARQRRRVKRRANGQKARAEWLAARQSARKAATGLLSEASVKTYKMASTIHEIALWATLLAYVVTVLLAPAPLQRYSK